MVRIEMLALALTATMACTEATAPTPPVAPGQEKTEGWRLGKFSTADGMVQMIIDRTGTPKAKLMIVGTTDIIELTPEEVRPRGELTGYVFKAPNGTSMLFVSSSGDMMYLRGRDELPLRRDGNAAPLGDATVAGTPPAPPEPPKSEAEVTAEKLSAITVTKKLSLSAKDGMKPAAVADAFARAEATMFVHYLAGSGKNVRWAPAATTMFHAHDKGTGALQKFGGELIQLVGVEQERGKAELKHWGLQVGTTPGGPAEGMPGLVWDVESHRVTFVTADGGRYQIELEKDGATLVPGIEGSLAKWPAPLTHAAIGPGELNHLAEDGVLAAADVAPVDKLQETWRSCVSGSFKKFQKDLEALDRQALDHTARTARKKEASEKWDAKVRGECKATLPKMETTLAGVIEARNKERLALFERVKARAAQLGLAK